MEPLLGEEARMSRPGDVPLPPALRALARDVHHLLMRGDASPTEAAELARRIGRLRCLAGSPASTPLSRWLESLQRLVEGHATPRRRDGRVTGVA